MNNVHDVSKAQAQEISEILSRIKEKGLSSSSDSSIPDVSSGDLNLDSLPSLSAPNDTIPMSVIMGLCEEAIMSMLGMEERKEAVSSGVATLQAHAEERKQINQERIEKLQEQAEKAEKQGFLDKLKQAFSIISCVIQAIAAVAVLASAVIAPNPASIIGAGLLIASTVETIMSTASDGKLSLQNGFAEAAKATGGNEQAAAICGMITSFAIGIAGSVLSGAGAAKTISDAAKLGEVSKLTKFQQIMNNATNIVSAGTQAASSAVNITSAVYEKQIDEIKADSKLLEAILMRIQIAQDLDTKQIEKIMEKATAMAEGVKDVIDDCNSTMQSVLSGGSAPAMA
mgnify:FL=1